MTCTETRECLYTFLDNELDARASIELQQHLDRCPACAQQIEIERAIHRQLRGVLSAGELHQRPDDRSLEAILAHAVTRPRLASWRRRTLMVAGLAAAAALVPTFWLLRRKHRQPSASPFIRALVDDLRHLREKETRVEIASADAVGVENWLLAETSLPVRLPRQDGAFTLLGGRKCSIAGQTAAFALYQQGDELASFVLAPAGGADLRCLAHRTEGRRSYWVGQCQGHTIVACQRGPLVEAVVGRAPEAELLKLMPSGNDESY